MTSQAIIDKINKQICARCIYDCDTPEIFFDQEGVCNYCHLTTSLQIQYGTGEPRGKDTLQRIVDKIKEHGRNKKYDCVVGISGGTDSSYLLHWALENKLRPLAVHYDNTWNTATATQNMHKILTKLNVDLYTHVCNNKEADDLIYAFLASSVAEIEAPTDLAIAEVMYRAAAKFKVKFILEGHSYTTEGITPLSRNYFDGKYIKSIHKAFGKKPLKTYPLMTFFNFIKWTALYRIKKIRPLWYLAYNKEQARQLLTEKYNWEYYSGHHLENRMSAFFHSIYSPNKVGIDHRNNSLSAAVRSGAISREEALIEYYEKAPYVEPGLENLVKKRLALSEEEYQNFLNAPLKHWSQFPTYKRLFERLRAFFFLLMKLNLVPHSFYLKYCIPQKT